MHSGGCLLAIAAQKAGYNRRRGYIHGAAKTGTVVEAGEDPTLIGEILKGKMVHFFQQKRCCGPPEPRTTGGVIGTALLGLKVPTKD